MVGRSYSAALQGEKKKRKLNNIGLFARNRAVETPIEGQSSGSHMDSDPKEDPDTDSGAAYHGDAAIKQRMLTLEQYREGARYYSWD